MKITIDTKEDSHSEIEKAIRLLQSLVDGRVKNSNIFEDDSPSLPTTDATPSSEPSSGGIFNMFGDNTPPPMPPDIEPEEKKEEREDMQLMEY